MENKKKKLSFNDFKKIKAAFDKKHDTGNKLLTYIAPAYLYEHTDFITLYVKNIGTKNIQPLIDNSFAEQYISNMPDLDLFIVKSGEFHFSNGFLHNSNTIERHIKENKIEFSFTDCLLQKPQSQV